MLGISAFSNPDEMRDEELVADIIDKCKAGDFEHPIEQRFLNLIWSPLEKLYLAGYQKQARDAKAAIDEKKAVANFKDLETGTFGDLS